MTGGLLGGPTPMHTKKRTSGFIYVVLTLIAAGVAVNSVFESAFYEWGSWSVEWIHHSGRDDWSVGPKIAIELV